MFQGHVIFQRRKIVQQLVYCVYQVALESTRFSMVASHGRRQFCIHGLCLPAVQVHKSNFAFEHFVPSTQSALTVPVHFSIAVFISFEFRFKNATIYELMSASRHRLVMRRTGEPGSVRGTEESGVVGSCTVLLLSIACCQDRGLQQEGTATTTITTT